jgi:hypothetical protein|uniref:Uncharacterized protein n=1 Tax=Siphoviridae sp. ctylc9 TaxID=2827977 RepID=A0A8S5S8P2_9CAUD|nr:MAG TPA: hypothetical protein [Siphoviridae sp. ctylc9]
MTKEQKEAIDRIKYNDIAKPLYCGDITICNIDDLKTILSMLEEQDKIIDLMAETINNHDIDEDICKQMGKKANCNEFEDTEKCKECIKQYFENKAKEIR